MNLNKGCRHFLITTKRCTYFRSAKHFLNYVFCIYLYWTMQVPFLSWPQPDDLHWVWSVSCSLLWWSQGLIYVLFIEMVWYIKYFISFRLKKKQKKKQRTAITSWNEDSRAQTRTKNPQTEQTKFLSRIVTILSKTCANLTDLTSAHCYL